MLIHANATNGVCVSSLQPTAIRNHIKMKKPITPPSTRICICQLSGICTSSFILFSPVCNPTFFSNHFSAIYLYAGHEVARPAHIGSFLNSFHPLIMRTRCPSVDDFRRIKSSNLLLYCQYPMLPTRRTSIDALMSCFGYRDIQRRP